MPGNSYTVEYYNNTSK